MDLKPGEPRTVTVTADPRLLAWFDGKNGIGRWRINAGTYQVALGKVGRELLLKASALLTPRVLVNR